MKFKKINFPQLPDENSETQGASEIQDEYSAARRAFRPLVKRSFRAQLDDSMVSIYCDSGLLGAFVAWQFTAPTEPDGAEVKVRQNRSIRTVCKGELWN
ncbi:hypothetical protein [Devosia sp.]|uniref:hypothetical protein n=1 Tax=Devosia sp. TaxID=1871048 RepID=UPI002733A59A|nr:hypothetical protein [Devosia sp.]MDP2779605.1 hypothetical protein [Devosia sp.]